MRSKYFKKGKVHKKTGSDEILCKKNPPIWDMTWKDHLVTCKRCKAKLKKAK